MNTGYPIPADLPVTPRATPKAEPWPRWTGVRYGANHDRPARPQGAGHERERDDE